MPLDAFVTGTVETSLNQLLKDDADSQRRLARLRGKVISVTINEFSKTLYFVFSHQIDVLAGFEGEVDCQLALNLTVLPELRQQANLTQLIKADKLALDGDLQLAQHFSTLLSGLKPDVEEKLSQYTGDVVAHTLVSSVKSGSRFIRQGVKNRQRDLAEVITEEWQLLPQPLEMVHFYDQVDDLKSDVARFEARLNQLLER
ncbi:ubiquinone biosynthesis accessory factor UbiJ [Photobacterium angustum]|uniref:ubiquinone biosynthesis accessory factor UbiJ n=1 Tax=Photobacterium angustum TaxID=661 RepID=UPI0005E24770|nr:SCP2 domain-containing protein [Photobacterium angustum]KJG00750.1 membrane protein [Photobacterium angustum]KJG16042.1 membrane protein [Photobacterium angustum]KJG21949.1 membrane protein [Photobacterium angustum]KJG28419.1 membrane protein [Photobacterium angustum]PSV65631.1 SCP2 domain-containing protein [Photobacterium angustum]